MIKKLSEIKEQLMNSKPSKVAVVCPYEKDILEALKEATDCGIIQPMLVGDEAQIKEVAKAVKLDLDKCEIKDVKDEIEAAEVATKLVSSKEADTLMKGLIDTSKVLKAALNKEWGLRSGNPLAHIALFEHPTKGLIAATDCAVNITHTKDGLKKIIDEAVKHLKKIHGRKVKVALISANEKVNPKIEASMMYQELLNEYSNDDAIIAGPYAVDNAISKESCEVKGITGEVAGQADLLVFPDLISGNVFYKSMIYLGGAEMGGMIMGTTSPIIVSSRADSKQNKLNSIYLAQYLAGDK